MSKKKNTYFKDLSFIAITLVTLFVCVAFITALEQRDLREDFQTLTNEIKSLEYLVVQEKGINLTQNSGFYNGFYFVTQTKDMQLNDIFETATHEIGHHFLNVYVDNQDYKAWIKIHNNSQEFVSNYSMTDDKEDFSETFAYVIKPCYFEDYANDLEQEKREYFEQNVKPYFQVCQ